MFIDGGFVDEARSEFRHGAIAEFAFAQCIRRLFPLGDVERHADEARELSGDRIGNGAIADLEPAQLAIGPADLRRELDGLAARVLLGARLALLAPAVSFKKA